MNDPAPATAQEGLREAFTVAALNYARAHWGTPTPMRVEDEGAEVIEVENEDHYRDRMRDAWEALNDATEAQGDEGRKS